VELLAIYCGVDIIEVERIKKSMEEWGGTLRDKIFTRSEADYCEGRKKSKYLSYAARFAAKEAVSKALGTGISGGIKWRDIEIVNDEKGKPFVKLTGKAQERFLQLKGIGISVSLSHCKSYAVAYAIIEVGENK
jgi:holo-[acyl-carrier protein] synthase